MIVIVRVSHAFKYYNAEIPSKISVFGAVTNVNTVNRATPGKRLNGARAASGPLKGGAALVCGRLASRSVGQRGAERAPTRGCVRAAGWPRGGALPAAEAAGGMATV